ncbi:MAG TPA: phosphotransferase family protein [Novosphingobium sp.]
MSDVIVAPNTRDLNDLARDLTKWLANKLPDSAAVHIDNLDYPRGAGQSHETVLFDAHWKEGGAQRSQGCVLRIKPSSFTVFPDDLFEEQYQVMRVIHEGGYVPIARPLWFEEDPSLLGQPFFVMEKKYGRVPVTVPVYSTSGWLFDATPAQRRKVWENSVRRLAEIQAVPLDKVRFLAGPAHARDGLAQEWDKYERFVAWVQQDTPIPVLDQGLARLKSLWPKNQPEGIVWGDARMGNMMFDDDFDVVAVMDWEQPSLGGALQDLAWFISIAETLHGPNTQVGTYLEGMGSREETIALWEEVSGKSAADLEWYEDFTLLKMALMGTRMNMMRGEPIDYDRITRRMKLDQ